MSRLKLIQNDGFINPEITAKHEDNLEKKLVTEEEQNYIDNITEDIQHEELKNNLEKCGWEILSTWAMGDSLEDLAKAGNAEINLVVSSVGLRAAKALKEKGYDVDVDKTITLGYLHDIGKYNGESYGHVMTAKR